VGYCTFIAQCINDGLKRYYGKGNIAAVLGNALLNKIADKFELKHSGSASRLIHDAKP